MTEEKAAKTENYYCDTCPAPTGAGGSSAVYCFCQQPYSENSSPMILCDTCSEWYVHLPASGLGYFSKYVPSLQKREEGCDTYVGILVDTKPAAATLDPSC